MSLSKSAQFLELAKTRKQPLILLTPHPSRDALATSIALAHYFTGLGSTPTLAAVGAEKKLGELAFLPCPSAVVESLSGSRDFVLSFNTEHNPILDVRTERLDKELRIHLTPEHGTIDPRDFSFILAQYKFDLVITIGAPDKESLGTLYEAHPDIFYEVPVVNIDSHGSNEQYGQINLVEVTASSTAEIVAALLKEIGEEFLEDVVAEALLAGIMAATDSFQKKTTTPRALELASYLMSRGADQQKIVKYLYKTQPLHLLKLWGRIMSNIRSHDDLSLVIATVTIEDLVQARSSITDLATVLEKIRGNYAGATTFAVLYAEDQELTRIFVKTNGEGLIDQLVSKFPGSTVADETLEATVKLSAEATETFLREQLATLR